MNHEVKRVRVTCEPIRYRDLYCVSRRSRSIRIVFFAPANTTGEYAKNVRDSIVPGFAMYDGEPAGQYNIKILQMVESAICHGDYPRPVSESVEFNLASTLAERRALLREFISEHLEAIQDVDEEEDEEEEDD